VTTEMVERICPRKHTEQRGCNRQLPLRLRSDSLYHPVMRRPRLAVIASVSLLAAADGLFAQPAGRSESLAAWGKIQSVLQHPRCLNCHQAESPLQGDSRRPHVPRVVRGPQDHGVSSMKCGSCHNGAGNNPTSRTPGAPHWQLAPASMLWQGLSAGALCRSLKDPARNGKRSLADIVTHMETDKLVLWGWSPGAELQAVPVAHGELMRHMRVWVDSGAACPP